MSFKLVAILILVKTESLLQPSHKVPVEKQLVTSIEFPFAMKEVILPFANILVEPIEQIGAFSLTTSVDKVSFVSILIGVYCFPVSIMLPLLPSPDILLHVLGIGVGVYKGTFPFWHSFNPLTLVNAPIAKGVDTMSGLLIFLPFPFIPVSVAILVNPMPLAFLVQEGSFVTIPIGQLDRFDSSGILPPSHISCTTTDNAKRDQIIEYRDC